MKISNAQVQEIIQESGYEGILKQIERGGRICYKSEDKISDGSAKKFVDFLIKREHYGPLEHGTVYLKFPLYNNLRSRNKLLNFFQSNSFSYVNKVKLHQNINDITGYAYVTTNYRVIVENNLEKSIQSYLCDKPTKYHRKRRSFLILCDRGVSHELVRHRVMSFNQESTRYVNYSQDKWGSEITVIKPCYLNDGSKKNLFKIWKKFCKKAERGYIKLIRKGATPQEARSLLPTSTKTELLITGFEDISIDKSFDEFGWNHFLKLRCDKAAHPQAREIAFMIKNLLYPDQEQEKRVE